MLQWSPVIVHQALSSALRLNRPGEVLGANSLSDWWFCCRQVNIGTEGWQLGIVLLMLHLELQRIPAICLQWLWSISTIRTACATNCVGFMRFLYHHAITICLILDMGVQFSCPPANMLQGCLQWIDWCQHMQPRFLLSSAVRAYFVIIVLFNFFVCGWYLCPYNYSFHYSHIWLYGPNHPVICWIWHKSHKYSPHPSPTNYLSDFTCCFGGF